MYLLNDKEEVRSQRLGPEMDDPLGARSDCVDLKELTRWNLTQLPMTSEDKDADISPFPWRNDLNSKLILWYEDYQLFMVYCVILVYLTD